MTKGEHSFVFKFSESLFKGLIIFVLLIISIVYLVYFFNIHHPSITQDRFAYISAFIIFCILVWAVGREVIITAIHAVKELVPRTKLDRAEKEIE